MNSVRRSDNGKTAIPSKAVRYHSPFSLSTKPPSASMPTTSSTSSNSARITACSKSKSPANGWAKASSKPMCVRNKASTSLPSKRATLPSSSPQATTSSAKTTTSSSPAPSKTSTALNTELSSQKTFRNHRSTRWFRFFYARHHALRLPLHNIPWRPSRNATFIYGVIPLSSHFSTKQHLMMFILSVKLSDM